MKLETIWNEVVEAVAIEFSDLPDVGQIVRVVLRLLLAGLLGGLLGYERERHGKAAGVRTHMLVSMGAALFVLVPQQAGLADADLARVVQGIVAGIGFLGAGAIVKGSLEEDVKGLTTAAGIWMTAAIGVAVGTGREATALLSTVMALLVLGIIPHLVQRFVPDEPAAEPGEAPPQPRRGDDAMVRQQVDDAAATTTAAAAQARSGRGD